MPAQKKQFTVRNDHASRLVSYAKQRAKEKGLPFNLSREDLVIPDLCPVLGIPVVAKRQTHATKGSSASIDRIVPALGYVRGNVRIISQRANLLRNTCTMAEIELLLEDAKRLASRDE